MFETIKRLFAKRSAREASRKPSMFRSYPGGDTNRLISAMFGSTGGLSINAEIFKSMAKIRARARELEQAGSHLTHALDVLESNVIGANGVQLQMKVKNKEGMLERGLNADIEGLWTEWGMADSMTASESLSWPELQRLLIRSMARDGEVFVRFIRGGNRFNLSLQEMESDHCDHTRNENSNANNTVVMGVSLSPFGKPLAYYMHKEHPGDRKMVTPDRGRIWIKAENVMHYFKRIRAGQVRGISMFAPVIIKIHHLDEYGLSELVSSRIQACAQGFYEHEPEANTQYEGDRKDASGEMLQEFTPGLWTALPTGVKAKLVEPTRPTSTYSQYVRSVNQEIAAGLGMSYATLSSDGSAENYSSMRQMALMERDMWRTMQNHFIGRVCQRVFREWVKMSTLSGIIPMARMADVIAGATWRGRAWSWVDPAKDASAAETSIQLRTKSRTQIITEMGGDIEDTFNEIAAEQAMAEQLGISLATADKGTAPPEADNPADDMSGKDRFAGIFN